ncbi:prefoldin subunit alpha [Serratia phage 4S]|nr:prefoldin subunit alpha [Serratia phage 4S]
MINSFRQDVLRVFHNPGRDYNSGTFLDCNGNKRLVSLSNNVSLGQAAFRAILSQPVHRSRIFQTLGQLMPSDHKLHRFQFAPNVLKYAGFSINFPDAFYVRMEISFDKENIKSAYAMETLLSAWTRSRVKVETNKHLIILSVDFDPTDLAIHPCAVRVLSEEKSQALALIKPKEPAKDKGQALFEKAIKERSELKDEIASQIQKLGKQISELNEKYDTVVQEINALAKARDIIKGN